MHNVFGGIRVREVPARTLKQLTVMLHRAGTVTKH